MLKEGQVFYADYAKPEGFCDEAWKAIYQYAFALSHGAGKEVFYYGDWIRKPGVAICSCNDGLRPVIFKLEATDEESEIDYTPVLDQKSGCIPLSVKMVLIPVIHIQSEPTCHSNFVSVPPEHS